MFTCLSSLSGHCPPSISFQCTRSHLAKAPERSAHQDLTNRHTYCGGPPSPLDLRLFSSGSVSGLRTADSNSMQKCGKSFHASGFSKPPSNPDADLPGHTRTDSNLESRRVGVDRLMDALPLPAGRHRSLQLGSIHEDQHLYHTGGTARVGSMPLPAIGTLAFMLCIEILQCLGVRSASASAVL